VQRNRGNIQVKNRGAIEWISEPVRARFRLSD